MLTKALHYLRCPRCGIDGAFTLGTSKTIECKKCGSSFSYADGFIDFFPEYQGSKERAQQTMENSFIVRIYEDLVRPKFTSIGTTVKYGDEEKWLRRQTRRLETPGVTVDLACGTGRYARIMSREYSAELVFGIDLSKPMLDLAVERNMEDGIDNIVYIRADSNNIPLSKDCSNWVNVFGALHLFPNPKSAIKEIARISRTDALVTFLTARKREDSFILRKLQQRFSKLAGFVFFGEEELEQYFRNLGYAPLEKECHGMLIMGASKKCDESLDF